MALLIEKMDNYTANTKYPPTPSQWQAIAISGADVLVSAAAGSGKTEVLSERISRKISLDRWDIDKILVLTFTTAAAKNMLVRIENKIQRRLLATNRKEDIEHLKRQRLLMADAKVSTIDSFCLNILKKFYYLVEEEINGEIVYLSPNFKVLANNKTLLTKSINLAVEKYSRNNSLCFEVIFDICNNDKNKVVSLLTNIYSKTLSIPNYKDYIKNELTKNLKLFIGNVDLTSFVNIVNNIDVHNIYNFIDNLENEATTLFNNIKKEKTFSEKLSLLNKEIDFNYDDLQFNSSINVEIDELTSFLKNLLEKIVAYKKDGNNDSLSEIYSDIKKEEDNFNIYKKLFLFEKSIVELILLVDNEFIFEKRKSGYLDFADLNHLSIKALEKTINNKKVLTEAGHYYRNLFLEIYVDEYQDNNDLQEYILNLVRGENTYFFRVGDVKQSIYGFRSANPDLFEEKYQTYEKLSNIISDDSYSVNKEYKIAEDYNGICVVLKENFRSRDNVLKSSNFVFNRLMENFGAGISYDKDSALYYPKVKKEDNKIIPTYIMSTKVQHNKEKVANELIIRNVANEILKNIKTISNLNKNLEDKDKLKGDNFCDYAILLRKSNNMKFYKDILAEYNIPVFIKEREGLTESHSFNIILNLLKFLNNQNLDTCLLVLLRSGIFNFNNDEIMKLSFEDGETFYKKLQNSNVEKFSKTYNLIKKWLNYSYNYSAVETVRQIVYDTDFITYLSAFENGFEEIDYFDNVIDILIESKDFINLNDSINVLLDIQQEGKYETKRITTQNSVTITTIHGSKGLEYNYVFLLELYYNFKTDDYNSVVIFSNKLGLSINANHFLDAKNINDSSYINKLNYQYIINSNYIKRKNIQEEIRNLYVAFTRAVDSLYIATNDKCSFSNEDLEVFNQEQITKQLIEVKSYSDMLALIMPNYEKDNLKEISELGALFENYILQDEFENIEKRIVMNDVLENINIDFNKIKQLKNVSEENSKFYPSKTSYSALKKINNEEQEFKKDKKEEYLVLKTLSKKSIQNEAILRGNIVHKLFEKIVLDVRKGLEISDVSNYLVNITKDNDVYKNVKNNKILSTDEYNFLNNNYDFEKIINFVNSDVIDLVKNCENLYTEILFTTMDSAKQFFVGSDSSEEVILQGVIDLLLKIDDDNFIIIDYKTDYLKNKSQKRELIKKHSRQLEIYADAVKNYYGKSKNVDMYIYSYTLSELIKL